MTVDMEVILGDLTDAQARAVRHMDGPVLVLAGPGSGKTRVITRRIAHLVACGVPAWSILALTFTNKAAGEMRNRVDAIVPASVPGRRGLTVTTFHSLGARLLRRYANEAGLRESFTIYDAGDQRDAMKAAIKSAGLDSKNFTPSSIHAHISHAKNQLVDAKTFALHAGDFFSKSVARAYTAYQSILDKAHALDFDDLLMRLALLLKDGERVRSELQERYQYLLIDEYQDTNHVQFMIAHTLASKHRNICVVGDPDQSIYGWRGADIRNILDFETHYADATVIPLGQNFRSTGHIVATADALIRHNRKRKHKDLTTELGAGVPPRVARCADEHHEARVVLDELRRHSEEEVPWRDMAVMYRVNALSRVVEDELRRAGVPYVIARGTAFYERQEIKDALGYLRLLANPADDISLRRIINTPARGIGRTSIDRLEAHAASKGLSMLEAAKSAAKIDGLTAKGAKAIAQFAAMVEGWRGRIAGARTASSVEQSTSDVEHRRGDPATRPTQETPFQPSSSTGKDSSLDSFIAGATISDLRQLVEVVLRESGLDAMYREARIEEDVDRRANLDELVTSAAQFAPPLDLGPEPPVSRVLSAYLESVALVSDADMIDPENGAVTLLTLHAAKGLEFKVVCIIGLEEGLLPHANSFASEGGIEEERRLCFVGITRAERHLLMTSANVRTHRGLRERTIPSTFLRELPEDHVVPLDMSDGDEQSAEEDSQHADSHGSSAWLELKQTFPIGSMVRHPQFGVGRIESIERQRTHTRARISFAAVGRKTLILEYARLEKVHG